MLVCSSGILVILVWLILADASDTSAGDTAVGDTGFADDILPKPELRYPYMIQLYNYSKNIIRFFLSISTTSTFHK